MADYNFSVKEVNMSVAKNWVIEQMDCYPQLDGQTNVVFNVHWRVNATDKKYSETVYGSVGINYVSDGSFTPYDKLNHDQVVDWVKLALGAETVADIEVGLEVGILNQANPPTVAPTLPWRA